MTSLGPESALEALRDRIEADHPQLKFPSELWFWPEDRSGVRGFLGINQVIVAGLNPSKGTGPSETDKFFYHCLLEEGLGDAHLTDLVKIRATRNDVPLLFYNPSILQLHRGYFAEEVNILLPAVVIALGREVLDVLRGWAFAVPDGRENFAFKLPNGSRAAVILTVHPSATRWPTRTKERRERFIKDIREARRVLEKTDGAI